ncbi:MAG: aminotransferase class I/II-fold pyridoxal phosphate-dependent enzyme, partial [Gammaproteobacteria bacterium]
AWADERHVIENRRLYTRKFSEVLDVLAPVLDVRQPDAGFYLWARTPGDDAAFARALHAHCHVTVLPGSFLSRPVDGFNPGQGYVRMALVAPLEDCIEAAQRIKAYIQGAQRVS